MSPSEFKNFLSLGEKTKPNLDLEIIEPDSFVELPSSVDWRQKGAVLKVKNQGNIGSSWMFSATGCLEGQNAIVHDERIPLSEQNLVECIDNRRSLMIEAFEYVRDNGIESEADYPSRAPRRNCSFDKDKSVLQVDQIYRVAMSEEALKYAVAQLGLVSVGVDASSFSFYGGGVFNPSNCFSSYINHGALAVGYGSEGNYDFWIVKNSWGAEWGEDGYIRLIRNHQNRCGIASMASAATVK
nr:unnamed protein product [Callosobruchus chinensis]